MKTIIAALGAHPEVTDFKINVHKKDSYELFFVKGKLETVRCTDTCDKEVTVYVAHDEFLGDAQFFVYASTTESQLDSLIDEAVAKAKLISNKPYTLPEQEEGSYEVASNFSDFTPDELAAKISNAVFGANNVENAALNSVEIFINKHTETVANSRGLYKQQVRYDAMVEAIPTYNGSKQSVELYEQYNFSNLDMDALHKEIAEKMAEVKARYEAVKPTEPIACKVILNKLELENLFSSVVRNLNYSMVYAHASVFQKGDKIQKDPQGDKITITLKGEEPGVSRSAKFDNDGITLGEVTVVEDGTAVNYFGDNRVGQYLGETPTGNMRVLKVAAGTASAEAFAEGPYLEVISMSGLQVDFHADYIGGEVRLAYWHNGRSIVPVTGISISGSVSDVLNHITFSEITSICSGYIGPDKAILENMKIF